MAKTNLDEINDPPLPNSRQEIQGQALGVRINHVGMLRREYGGCASGSQKGKY